ncbi:MAG: ATP-binding protein [Lachnospiraceae bacterium]|nr:ATP-binding protein [Lachnospiraceae bacterium]
MANVEVKEMTIDAMDINLQMVLDFIEEQVNICGCDPATLISLQIAVEEIFVNVAHYSYNPEIGTITIKTEIAMDDPKSITIVFRDHGVPYNPLEKPDPDITLGAEERQIGGLGIYLVKNSMDEVYYNFEDGENVFTIKKNL